MNRPDSRCSHATTQLDEDHIIMIGEYPTSDSWIFNVKTKLWKEVSHDVCSIYYMFEVKIKGADCTVNLIDLQDHSVLSDLSHPLSLRK